MSVLVLVLVCIINLFVSWANCYFCGRTWDDARNSGGFPYLLVWCGATQAAGGFSSILLVLTIYGGHALGYVSPQQMEAVEALWYLLVIVPMLGTGLIITIESWVAVARHRTTADVGTAIYNTAAMGSNLYHAMSDIPEASGIVKGLFSSSKDDDEGNPLLGAVILVVAAVLLGGVLLTITLIKHYRLSQPESRIGAVRA